MWHTVFTDSRQFKSDMKTKGKIWLTQVLIPWICMIAAGIFVLANAGEDHGALGVVGGLAIIVGITFILMSMTVGLVWIGVRRVLKAGWIILPFWALGILGQRVADVRLSCEPNFGGDWYINTCVCFLFCIITPGLFMWIAFSDRFANFIISREAKIFGSALLVISACFGGFFSIAITIGVFAMWFCAWQLHRRRRLSQVRALLISLLIFWIIIVCGTQIQFAMHSRKDMKPHHYAGSGESYTIMRFRGLFTKPDIENVTNNGFSKPGEDYYELLTISGIQMLVLVCPIWLGGIMLLFRRHRS